MTRGVIMLGVIYSSIISDKSRINQMRSGDKIILYLIKLFKIIFDHIVG